MNLGKLEKVDLRTTWESEAGDLEKAREEGEDLLWCLLIIKYS